MKPRLPRSLVILAAAGLVTALAWTAYHRVRSARLDRVTLRVTQAGLAEVIAAFERQTRESIIVADALRPASPGARLTLDLDDVPLAEALETVGFQVSGLGRVIHAVHDTAGDLTRLARTLAAGKDPAAEGWTNPLSGPFPPGAPGGPRSQDVSDGGGPGFQVDEEDVVALPPASSEDGGPSRSDRNSGATLDVVRDDAPNVRRRMVSIRGAGPGGTQVIDLSPEQLLVETTLAARLPAGDSSSVPAGYDATATRLAQRLSARHSRLFALLASPVPDLPGPSPRVRRFSGRDPSGKKIEPGALLPPPEDMVAHARRAAFDRIEQKTPEQRALDRTRRPQLITTEDTADATAP